MTHTALQQSTCLLVLQGCESFAPESARACNHIRDTGGGLGPVFLHATAAFVHVVTLSFRSMVCAPQQKTGIGFFSQCKSVLDTPAARYASVANTESNSYTSTEAS